MRPIITGLLIVLCTITKAQQQSIKDEILGITDYRAKRQYEVIQVRLEQSGSCLVKARKQILEGFACDILAGAAFMIGTSTYNNLYDKAMSFDHPVAREDQLSSARSARNIIYGGAGLIAIAGTVLEVTGIINIGKAGLILRNDGVGVKIDF